MPRVRHVHAGISIKNDGPLTLSSKLRDPKVTDFTEEELGIFEDEADCADLTESEEGEENVGGDTGDDYGDEALDTIRDAPLPAPKSYISTTGLTTTTKNIIDVQMAHAERPTLEVIRAESEVSDAAHTIYSGKRNTPVTLYADQMGYDQRYTNKMCDFYITATIKKYFLLLFYNCKHYSE